MPNSGIRLPPRVFDGEAFAWPGMKDKRHWEPVIRQFRHSRPGHRVFLAPTPKRSIPESDDEQTPHGWIKPASEAQGKPDIESDRLLDDLGREAVAAISGRSRPPCPVLEKSISIGKRLTAETEWRRTMPNRATDAAPPEGALGRVGAIRSDERPGARVFIGIRVDPEIARQFATIARSLEIYPVRLIRAADIHLTLVPPWTETNIADAVEGLRHALQPFGSFNLDRSDEFLAGGILGGRFP
ncbi:protein of unknown function (plasmid) [Methylocella tundrae]|uniref:2'-5' RNA ligase n=1 Tax=Methylocella tundrae TaxID=227605 RepID=A0A4U8Z745_METTU|nr:protein of unknown function [Methylocella tundrae]